MFVSRSRGMRRMEMMLRMEVWSSEAIAKVSSSEIMVIVRMVQSFKKANYGKLKVVLLPSSVCKLFATETGTVSRGLQEPAPWTNLLMKPRIIRPLAQGYLLSSKRYSNWDSHTRHS